MIKNKKMNKFRNKWYYWLKWDNKLGLKIVL